MAAKFPPCPTNLKPIAHYLNVAQEHDARDPVVAYWSRLYALQSGLKLSTKQQDETALLIAIMEWLEVFKKQHKDNEAITNEVVAQAHLENYALKLFNYADQQDRAANFQKNVVKSYYTAGMIYDVLLTFGEPGEEATHNRRYAKYKAAYIHNCLKNGETPIPGPHSEDGAAEDKDDNEDVVVGGQAGPSGESSERNEQPSPPANQPLFPPPQTPHVDIDSPPTDLSAVAAKLPSPPVDPETKNPGGFQAYDPSSGAGAEYVVPKYAPPSTNVELSVDQMGAAQKYCKYAGSALNYNDVKTAVDYLEKALYLLATGKEK